MNDETGTTNATSPTSPPALPITLETANQLIIGAPKYRPLIPMRVPALQMKQPFRLTETKDVQAGETGDYLVQTDRGFEVVPEKLFEEAYVKIKRKTKKDGGE